MLGNVLRRWARKYPHEFQLIYGTPIPGYVAPPETVGAAGAVAAPFLEVGAQRTVEAYAADDLTAQARRVVELAPGSEPSGAAAVLAELAALVGMLTLELSGHFVGSAEPADYLYEALLDRQVATLGLDRRDDNDSTYP